MTEWRMVFACIAAGATLAAAGWPVKGRSGAMMASFAGKPAGKVWTWKEMFFHLTLNTWPAKTVIPEAVNRIGRSYWLESGNGSIKDICFLAPVMTWSANAVAYDSRSLETIRLPYVTTVGYQGPTMNSAGPISLYVPKLKGFGDKNYTFYSNHRQDIYISESTISEILAFANFPGCQAAKYQLVFFHGSDGTISWNGAAWETSTADAAPPYPYEQDEIPAFADDPSDLYWKDLFFKLTEDTWDASVTFPAEINRTGRAMWLVSSKITEVTMLCSSFQFGNNPVCYGANKLRTVRMPNVDAYNYPGPTMNGGCTALYIPKCKSFGNNIALGTNQARLDVYIDESTCSEILAMRNFPGCTGTTRSKVFFHGSDGEISFDGTSWIVTYSRGARKEVKR